MLLRVASVLVATEVCNSGYDNKQQVQQPGSVKCGRWQVQAITALQLLGMLTPL